MNQLKIKSIYIYISPSASFFSSSPSPPSPGGLSLIALYDPLHDQKFTANKYHASNTWKFHESA